MNSKAEKLVILGTGFAAIQILKHIDLRHYEVTVVSPRNYFLFTPLLASTTVGTIEFRSIIEPVRNTRSGFNYCQASCEKIKTESKTLLCRREGGEEFELGYDTLVIGVGAGNALCPIDDVEKHALFLKDLDDARKIRQRIIQCFEQAALPNCPDEEGERLLHFVVVGGGPTGVEFAAELADFLRDDLSEAYSDLAKKVRVTIVEATDRLLGSFAEVLSSYTSKALKKSAVEIRNNSLVNEIKEGQITLRDGTVIPFGLLVWSTGIGPTKLVAESDFEKDKSSRILVDPYLKAQGHDDIYSAGDCAMMVSTPAPATAQVAQQQGKYLAKSFNRLAKNKPAKPFKYTHMGMLAYVGSNKALVDHPSFKGRGFIAWLMWRSIYLTKLVSLKNKMLVLFDWFKTKLFGRDISRF